MPSVIDSLGLVSSTMGQILDFVAQDETLSNDFKNYLEQNNIEINSESEFNNIIISYALDMKMKDGLRVLEYYRRNNKVQDEIIDALSNSICSVFRVDKILSNAYEVTCLTSSTKVTLVPMVKMNHLKQIGRNDFFSSRIIELDNNLYILEIYEIISEHNVFLSTIEAIKYMLNNPKLAHYKNEQKKIELQKSIQDFDNKFHKLFKDKFITTTNKKVDDLIKFFNDYRLSQNESNYSSLIQKPDKYEYFKIQNNFQSDFQNEMSYFNDALIGFSSCDRIYDIALWMDKKRGLYVIPFFETFLKSFRENIENKEECIREFLTNDKIPPSVIKYAYEQNEETFFETINNVLNTDFSTLEELLFNTKAVYIDDEIYSPICVLYNSELFSKLGNFEKEYENINQSNISNNAQNPIQKKQTIGRNDPCPCGSGLKYKKCCGKN